MNERIRDALMIYLVDSGLANEVKNERRVQLSAGVPATDLKLKEPHSRSERGVFFGINVEIEVTVKPC
jgi:hypothetical protein